MEIVQPKLGRAVKYSYKSVVSKIPLYLVPANPVGEPYQWARDEADYLKEIAKRRDTDEVHFDHELNLWVVVQKRHVLEAELLPEGE